MPQRLTLKVLLAMGLGAVAGVIAPEACVQLQFVSDIFIRLVKMVIAPIVFITLVTGLSSMGSLRQVGVLGLRALIYFEVVTSTALALGVGCALLFQPGAGFDPKHLANAATLAQMAPNLGHTHLSYRDTILHLVPDSAVGALAHGDLLPVLVFAVLFGIALARTKETTAPLLLTLERLGAVFFDIIGLIMRLSPVAAFAAVAFSVGQFGVGSLLALGKLLLAVYTAMGAFMLLILMPISRAFGFSFFKLLRHIQKELVLVFGTSSSESALPRLITKLEEVGCDRSVVGLVVPTGYSFNLDGTSIYLSMAVLFIAQAYNIALSTEQIAWILGVLMLTSKGAAGVTGSGFITLAATLSALPDQPIPVQGLVLLVGVDRFMSVARSMTNLVGNSVATVVLAKVQRSFVDRGLI